MSVVHGAGSPMVCPQDSCAFVNAGFSLSLLRPFKRYRQTRVRMNPVRTNKSHCCEEITQSENGAPPFSLQHLPVVGVSWLLCLQSLVRAFAIRRCALRESEEKTQKASLLRKWFDCKTAWGSPGFPGRAPRAAGLMGQNHQNLWAVFMMRVRANLRRSRHSHKDRSVTEVFL